MRRGDLGVRVRWGGWLLAGVGVDGVGLAANMIICRLANFKRVDGRYPWQASESSGDRSRAGQSRAVPKEDESSLITKGSNCPPPTTSHPHLGAEL